MSSFFRTYKSSFPKRNGVSRLLEVGSRVFHGDASYKKLITEDWIEYIGIDLEPGENVDVVPKSGYVWPEIDDDSVDVCISGQTFEHNAFFWATMAEISRVLVPGGLICIIAPGSQAVHRYPVDCWRFYPDSWAALCALTGLDPLEVYFETDRMALSVPHGYVRDCMVIARKPEHPAPEIKERLELLTKPFKDGAIAFEAFGQREGPCIADYRQTAPKWPHWRAKLARLISPLGPVRVFEPTE